MRVRQARTLFTYWADGTLVFVNFRTQTAVSADRSAIDVLDFFSGWRDPEALVSERPEYTARSVRRTIRELLAATLLVREGTTEALRDAQLSKTWSTWLPYGAFHFGTKDVPFVRERQVAGLLRRLVADSRQPSFFKRYRHAPRLGLARPRAAASEFPRVLLARRTHREFSQASLPLDALSRLLYYTWGVTGRVPAPPLGRLPLKTSPSGGARHPGEVYLLALRVSGLARGLYHYDAERHSLERLRKGAVRSQASRYCANQSFADGAAALFLMTAVLPRTMWKYRFARAYRVVLLDAGHLCQTFCLTATWLGLAPFCTAALKDSLIERDLGIDGVTEVILYAAGVGLPRDRYRRRGVGET